MLLVRLGVVVLLLVLALSLLHFALGELEVVRETTTWRPSRVAAAAFGIAGTGALILPLARAGGQLSGVAAAISPALGTLLAVPTARVGLAALWVVAALVAGTSAVRARSTGCWSTWSWSAPSAPGSSAGRLRRVVRGLARVAHSARLLTVDQPAASLVVAGRHRGGPRAGSGGLGPSLAAVPCSPASWP